MAPDNPGSNTAGSERTESGQARGREVVFDDADGTSLRVGVLALQGGFAAHVAMLDRLGVVAEEVRTPEALVGLAGLILPGGESTTHLHLMREGMVEAVQGFAQGGGALFGTCAGAILMASEVNPDQESLGLLDVSVERNAYGRQLGSFEARLQLEDPEGGEIDGVFIRAPRFASIGEGVRVLARHQGDPVLVEQGLHLAATFHPELTDDTAVHQRFVRRLISHASASPSSASP